MSCEPQAVLTSQPLTACLPVEFYCKPQLLALILVLAKYFFANTIYFSLPTQPVEVT